MSSENSSPWNVAAAASASPEAVSPWAVSPFQTSNPFKSQDTSSSSTETEPEPDVVSSVVVVEDLSTKTKLASAFSAAFEPEKEAEDSAASGAWKVAPVAKAEETAPVSAWTLATIGGVEKVKKDTHVSVEEAIAPVVKEIVAAEVAAEKEKPEVQAKGEETISAVQKVAESAWTTAPVVKETAVVEEAEDGEELAVVVASASVKPAEETPALVVDKAVVLHKAIEKEPLCATSSAWTTAPVEEGALSAWTSTSVLEKVDPIVAEVEATVKGPVAPEEIVEPMVETVAVEVDVELETESDPVEEATVETGSPWTAASTQEEVASHWTAALGREEAAPVKITTPELALETVELVAEKPELVVTAPKPAVETLVDEDDPMTSASLSTFIQEETPKEAAFAEDAPIKEEVAAVAEASVEEIATVVEIEKVVAATSSAWNTTPIQEEVTACKVDRSVMEAGRVQETDVVEVTKETPVSAMKEIDMSTEALAENGKIDKKAIANAFEGVASYKVDSVTMAKKIPSVEAVAAKSTDVPGACGACGIGGCSIQ